MKAASALRLLGVVALLTTLVGCVGILNFVRTSPDGRYITVIAGDEEGSKLLLYDLNTRELTEVYTSQDKSIRFFDIQWRPDSQAFCFAAVPDSEQLRLMLYEVDMRRLTQLPVESAGLARWSRDGSRLIVLTDTEDAKRLDLYDTATWKRVRSYPELPCGAVSSDTAVFYVFLDERVLLLGEPYPSISAFPSGSNLYLFAGNRWLPYTTTGDVVTFWVAPDESRVRWVRCRWGKWLAVFESPLTQRMPRRITLLEDSTLTEARHAYRFSPDGTKLAWCDEENVYVWDMQNRRVRAISIMQPQSLDGSKPYRGSTQPSYSLVGFDWRDNNTLVIQRGDEIEQVSVHELSQ